ncbi:GNAT family N-acetyltransferase [Actinocorallia libanotica]|uniref:N-acetyltransferase domain-containing protein n=1 Tax=Actinocorallia libanotica TaxID=46162 RepID=A0ABN1RX34_9ACTN
MPRITDNPAESRYEIFTDEGALAGFSTYTRRDDHLVFWTTEISAGFEGHNLGGALVRGALEDIRARGLKVVPRCPYVLEYLERHLEFDGLRA